MQDEYVLAIGGDSHILQSLQVIGQAGVIRQRQRLQLIHDPGCTQPPSVSSIEDVADQLLWLTDRVSFSRKVS